MPCDPPAPPGVTCYRGDNIFADILPGQCNEYQYDVASDASPGTFWWAHPSRGRQTFRCILALLAWLRGTLSVSTTPVAS